MAAAAERSSTAIRKGRASDLPDIKAWLDEEGLTNEFGHGFHNNWSMIEEAAHRQRLTVLLLAGAPIAFYVDGNSAPDIFEVHPAHRREGHGERLARHMLRAWARRASLLKIQCSPEESLKFWQRFGFRQYNPGYSGVHAYLVLDRKHILGKGPRRHVSVAFYPRQRNWDDTIEPSRVYAGDAEVLNDGTLKLSKRAIGFIPENSNGYEADCVVRIEVDGALVFEDKVKRDEAAALGMQHDTTYYMDRLRLPMRAI